MYAQTFDELIRQTTINCAERGFLLVRVRDEVKMTILAYQTLYESSVAYGMRKAMQAEQSKAEKLNKLAALHQISAEQEDTIARLKQQIRDMLQEEIEGKAEGETQHEEVRTGFYEQNQQFCV